MFCHAWKVAQHANHVVRMWMYNLQTTTGFSAIPHRANIKRSCVVLHCRRQCVPIECRECHIVKRRSNSNMYLCTTSLISEWMCENCLFYICILLYCMIWRMVMGVSMIFRNDSMTHWFQAMHLYWKYDQALYHLMTYYTS